MPSKIYGLQLHLLIFILSFTFLMHCQWLAQKDETSQVSSSDTTTEPYQPYEFATQEMMAQQLNAHPPKPPLQEGQWFDAAPFWIQITNPSLGQYRMRFFAKDLPNVSKLDKAGNVDIHAFTIKGNKAWRQRFPMLFKPLRIEGQMYSVATMDLEHNAIPLSRFEIKMQMVFPTMVQSKSIYASHAGQKYNMHREVIAIHAVRDNEAILYHEGTPELFFGVTGFNQQQQPMRPVKVESAETKKRRTRFRYVFDQALSHVDVHVAKALMKPRKSMIVSADAFYHRLGAHVITFDQHPSSVSRKVIPGRATLKTPKHAIKIENKILVIDQLYYGKLSGEAWIHIKPDQVVINGKTVQPQ